MSGLGFRVSGSGALPWASGLFFVASPEELKVRLLAK